jgi:hypothetical protein
VTLLLRRLRRAEGLSRQASRITTFSGLPALVSPSIRLLTSTAFVWTSSIVSISASTGSM